MTALRVVACAFFRRDTASADHDLARAFRAGDEGAFAAVLELAVQGLARGARDLTAASDVTVVAMPGHRAGARHEPLDRLAAELAARRPGWTAFAALDRVADGPEAKHAASRDAPAEAHALRWADVPRAGPVLLLDDVIRTGVSLEAARLAAPPALRGRLVALAVFRAKG